MKKGILLLSMLAAFVGAGGVLAPWAEGKEIYSHQWAAMGTILGLTIAADDPSMADLLFRQSEEETTRLEKILSAHLKDSELSRLNRLPADNPMAVSRELWEALSAGVAWQGKTGGTFDITISPLIDLWKEAGGANRIPTPGAITVAMGKTGVAGIRFNAGVRTIRKTGDVRIDLGGLGKGFTADCLAASLHRSGISSALVGMAGDIYALGHRPDGSPWRVGVQDPRVPDDMNALATVVYLADRAVSTSGNYHRFVTIDGRRYSHILDPRTGWPADAIPSVTVIGPDTLTTDILGTALSVLGISEGMALVESLPEVEALFITLDDRGDLILTRSSGFAVFEDPDRAPQPPQDFSFSGR